MLSGLVRVNRNLLTIPTQTLELHDTFNQGKKGEIPAATDIIAGVNLGTALTVNDITSFYQLAAKFLTAKSLAV
jgi:hypothetical protein